VRANITDRMRGSSLPNVVPLNLIPPPSPLQIDHHAACDFITSVEPSRRAISVASLADALSHLDKYLFSNLISAGKSFLIVIETVFYMKEILLPESRFDNDRYSAPMASRLDSMIIVYRFPRSQLVVGSNTSKSSHISQTRQSFGMYSPNSVQLRTFLEAKCSREPPWISLMEL